MESVKLSDSPNIFHSSFGFLLDFCSGILLSCNCFISPLDLFFTPKAIFQNEDLIISPSFLETLECFLIYIRINSKYGQSCAWSRSNQPNFEPTFPFSLLSSDIGIVSVSVSVLHRNFAVSVYQRSFPSPLSLRLTHHLHSFMTSSGKAFQTSLTDDFLLFCALIALFTSSIYLYGCYFIYICDSFIDVYLPHH